MREIKRNNAFSVVSEEWGNIRQWEIQRHASDLNLRVVRFYLIKPIRPLRNKLEWIDMVIDPATIDLATLEDFINRVKPVKLTDGSKGVITLDNQA